MNKMIRSPYSETQKEQRVNFFMVDNDYVRYYARHLGKTATVVYMSLLMHADYDTKRCFPSMETIGKQHGIERHTVGRAISKLEEWNMIRIERLFDRKLVKRKNYTYTLIPIELWKKLPVEDDELVENEDNGIEDAMDDDDDLPFAIVGRDDHNESYGTKDTTRVVSKIPYNGSEDANNNTHIIKTKEEDSICGEPTELSLSLSKESQLLEYGESQKTTLVVSKSAVWNSDQAVLSLIKNDCKDYQIIGEYFYMQQYSFKDRPACKKAVERSLRAAKELVKYNIDDIRKTMKWMKDSEFDMGWSLETVLKYIDDCIKTNFIPSGTSRIELLNKLNTIKIPNELVTQPETTAFMTFWNAYPKKMDRLSAEKVFKTIDPKLYPKILDSLELQKKTEQWYKAEYIPLASKWLENRRWEDEISASSIINPEEAWARECAKKWPIDQSDNAQFMFTKKYPVQNCLKWKSILGL